MPRGTGVVCGDRAALRGSHLLWVLIFHSLGINGIGMRDKVFAVKGRVEMRRIDVCADCRIPQGQVLQGNMSSGQTAVSDQCPWVNTT